MNLFVLDIIIDVKINRSNKLIDCTIDCQPDSDISAYTYERTLMMEQRNALLAKMHIKKHSITVTQPFYHVVVLLVRLRYFILLGRLSD